MSTTTEPEYAGETPHADHEAHQHQHPSDRQYIVVALILAVITVAEVSTYFFEDLSTTALVILLFPMMIAKFAIVCGWFMHLRYDNPLFRRVFVFGLSLAVVVYLIVLTVLHFWSSDYGNVM
jgi:cytochrome c oxidase subunit IV